MKSASFNLPIVPADNLILFTFQDKNPGLLLFQSVDTDFLNLPIPRSKNSSNFPALVYPIN